MRYPHQVWISDPGNHRILRVDVKTEAVLDTVMFLLRSYTSAVDWQNTTRVFSNFLEFEVDYSVPLTPSSGRHILSCVTRCLYRSV